MSHRIQIRKGLLKRLRDLSGVTSEDAQARMLNVSRSSIYRAENGEQPSAAFMAAVCATYNLGLGEAFEIVDTKSPRQTLPADTTAEKVA